MHCQKSCVGNGFAPVGGVVLRDQTAGLAKTAGGLHVDAPAATACSIHEARKQRVV